MSELANGPWVYGSEADLRSRNSASELLAALQLAAGALCSMIACGVATTSAPEGTEYFLGPDIMPTIERVIRRASEAPSNPDPLLAERRISHDETAAHTPGPWRLVHGDIHDHSEDGEVNGFTILMGEYDRGGGLAIHCLQYAEGIYPEDREHAEAEANARLIAAAPDMSDVCASFSVIERNGRVVLRINGTEIVAVPGDTTEGMVLRQFGQNRREAIAKAESRS